MLYRTIFFLCFLTPVWLFAQISESNGLYFDKNKQPYSGTYIEYYTSGTKKIEIPLSEGKKNGKVVLYFENGNVNEYRSYVQNLMDGIWETFNIQNIKIAEASYKNNLKHGKWFIWDDKGTKRYEMEYFQGKKVGKWYIWDENGALQSEKDFGSVPQE